MQILLERSTLNNNVAIIWKIMLIVLVMTN